MADKSAVRKANYRYKPAGGGGGGGAGGVEEKTTWKWRRHIHRQEFMLFFAVLRGHGRRAVFT